MKSSTINDSIRDPDGTLEHFKYLLATLPSREALQQRLPTLSAESTINLMAAQLRDTQTALRYQYGMGMPLAELSERVIECVDSLVRDAEFIRANGGRGFNYMRPVKATDRQAYSTVALSLLLTNDEALAKSVDEMLSPLLLQRSYLLDMLVKAFVPGHGISKTYEQDKYIAPWSDPIVRALALPREQRPVALAAHMKNWTRLMRPFGWKPNLDSVSGKDIVFCDFAFEVALAVCGWDIDDSSFADHPYYPADLVRYYRANIRHSRDVWRAEGAGAGVEIIPPPPPAKSDLAKTKRKGIARWVELVSDGDQDATDAVLESIGKPRKIKKPEELVQALGEADIAIHADIKDDDTLAAQADGLSGARGLGHFDGPSEPPAGPARCVALLRAWEAWLDSRNYRLIAIDAGDDAWHAVLVRKEFYAELQALSAELAIALGEPAIVFTD